MKNVLVVAENSTTLAQILESIQGLFDEDVNIQGYRFREEVVDVLRDEKQGSVHFAFIDTTLDGGAEGISISDLIKTKNPEAIVIFIIDKNEVEKIEPFLVLYKNSN